MLRILTEPSEPPAVDELGAWWEATAARRAAGATTIERAMIGGVAADRLGFAFAGGYREALRQLVPGSGARATALCATEEGGAHPRAIRTALVRDGEGWTVTGVKKWASAASLADELMVIASEGAGEDGKNRLRAVMVPAGAAGVRMVKASAAFVPEIPHAEVVLENVRVPDSAILPGDGYEAYLKPFRTIEDLHVHAALLGYLIGVVRRYRLEPALGEQLLALAAATATIAAGAALAPATHLALAGLIELVGGVVTAVERAWEPGGGDEWGRWQRDRVLLRVAGKARAARLERARTDLTPHPSVAELTGATR